MNKKNQKLITLTHNDGKTEKFGLLFKEPPKPYLKINDLFLRLSDIPYGTININNLYPYVEKVLYCADEKGYLRKLDTHNDKKLWEIKMGQKVNSIVLNDDKDVYIGVNKNIKQLDSDKSEICTIQFPNNYVELDNKFIYVVYKNTIVKFNSEIGKEEFTVILKNDIKQVHVDSKNNLYLLTNTGIVKLLCYNLQKEWTYTREKIKNMYINKEGKLLILVPNQLIELSNDGNEVNTTNLDKNYDFVIKKEDGTYYVYGKTIKKIDNAGKETWLNDNDCDISSMAIE